MRFRICNSSFNDGTKRFNTADLWAAFPFASFATKPPPPPSLSIQIVKLCYLLLCCNPVEPQITRIPL